ncbi:MAG: PepSY-associated TM helix domain-containing protein [Pseudomonadota bacterium]
MFKLDQDHTKTLVAVHGWSGVSLGILLYAVLVTGMIAVLAEEIAHWSNGIVVEANPLSGTSTNATPIQDIVDKLEPLVEREYVEEVALGSTTAGALSIFFHKHQTNQDGVVEEIGTQFEVDPQSGEVLHTAHGTGLELFLSDEDRALSRFLVSVHTELHLPRPWGLILTGILGLAMLVAAISGLLMHRHLIKDLFTLRRKGNPVLVVKDAHTVAGSWGLPFAFVLAFTGSFFSFAGSIGLPVMAMVGFGGDQEAMFEVMLGSEAPEDPTPTKPYAIDHVLRHVQAEMDGVPSFVVTEHYGRADAMVTVFLEPKDGALSGMNLVYSGTTGEFDKVKPVFGQAESVGSNLFDLMGPLHFGNFLGLFSKSIWLALGFAMCFVTVTGTNMWLARRGENSFAALKLMMAVVTFGLPVALVGSALAFFLTIGSGGASFWTPLGFLMAAGAVLLYAALVRTPETINRHLACALVVGCVGIVGLRVLTGPGWAEALSEGQAIIVTIDLLLLLVSATLAWRLRRRLSGQATTSPARVEARVDMISHPENT